MGSLADELRERKTLDDEGLRELLETGDDSLVEELHRNAREVATEQFGRVIWLRALIEWSNICRNDCLYCGIRKSNRDIRRYSLPRETILECCDNAWRLGVKTFVLQGGENPAGGVALAPIVAEIRASWPEAAISLSLGELPSDTYRLLRRSGANRYLLRHETANPAHYARLHPPSMKLENRLACLRELRSLGYLTGMGMMVGSPWQTTGDLIADIRLIESFKPEMIGTGPFIPHHSTPLGHFPAGSPELTLRIYSILRLMLPKAWIPSTTALATLMPDGRTAGILAGANVVMPNFTPVTFRDEYSLYEGKSRPGAEAAETLNLLIKELDKIGYHV